MAHNLRLEMEEGPPYDHLEELTSRIRAVIQDEPTCLLFLQHCLFFCLLHVEDPQTIFVLQERDSDTWRSIIIPGLCLEKSHSAGKWSAYCLGRLVYTSGAEISRTLLNEPWDDSREDITPAELRLIYSNLFATELSEPKAFEVSEQQRINAILEQSALFMDTPLVNTVEWYEMITSHIPVFLPLWSEMIPQSLIPTLGIQALSWMKAIIFQAQEQCPSLRDHNADVLLILASYGLCPQIPNYALDEWVTSGNGQNWYRSLVDTFRSTKELAICLLTLAILLCVPPYQRMSSAPGAHQPSQDPLLDLGTFVERQGPNNRREILEKTAFSAIRVLTDENFQLRFPRPQQREHIYLSKLLKHALGKKPTQLGCLEGTLDGYWKTKITDPKDHTKAFADSLAGLAAAGPQGVSCSRMTSSTTLNGNIDDEVPNTSKIKTVHFYSNPMIECNKERTQKILKSRPVLPEYFFDILFLGRPGVGKSQIISKAVHGKCADGYTPTSYDVHSKSIQAGDKSCRLDIVDIGGQEPCETTNTTWYSKRWEEMNRDAVVLVYDTTSRKSFEAIPALFDPTAHPQDAIIMLIGSKIDRKQHRQVQPEEGMVLAKKLGGTFWEVSPLKGRGINEIFQCLAILLLERQQDQSNSESPQNSFFESEKPQKSLLAYLASGFLPCMGRV